MDTVHPRLRSFSKSHKVPDLFGGHVHTCLVAGNLMEFPGFDYSLVGEIAQPWVLADVAFQCIQVINKTICELYKFSFVHYRTTLNKRCCRSRKNSN